MSRRTKLPLPALAAVAALVVAVALAATTLGACGAGEDGPELMPVPGEAAPFAAGAEEPTADAEPPPELPRGRGFILARVHRPVLVHDRPGGEPIARLRPQTPFELPRTLGVIATRERGAWLAVHSPVLDNGTRGWIPNDPDALTLSRTRWSVRVWLGRREVRLRHGRRVVRRIPIAIGAAGSPTPTGRFQVTDKLPGARYPAGSYGCCIIALSARQPNPPPHWVGGDRIAIHGTPRADTIGSASSNGCLRATDRDLRALMRHVPVGAPVFINP